MLRGPARAVKGFTCIAYSADSKRLAAGGADKTVRVWDTATGRELLTLRGHENEVRGVVFSPDGTRLASASVDKTVRVWDAASGRELLTLSGHASIVHGVAFSPDGAHLASAGDVRVLIWNARPWTNDVRDERDARSRLEFLLDHRLLKDDVRDFLRTDKTVSDAVRQLALKLLDQYGEDPNRLNSTSWLTVRQPNGDAVKYRRAVQLAEAACRLKPDDGNSLNTLGVAYYRAGQYQQALDTLARSRPLSAKLPPVGDHPADVAFLAMCHQQLGQPDQARKLLAELRTLCQKAAWTRNAEAQAFLREAEALIPPEAPRP
jgi:hypothetical protein